MRLHALTCGWLTGPLGNFLAGVEGEIRVPVPCFVIDHPQGVVLFDAGLHPTTQHDPIGRLGTRLASLFQVHFAAGEEVATRLAAIEIEPARVRHLVLSHLHFDHAGGVETIPNARLVVQRPEWEAGRDPDRARRNAYDPKDYDLGHDVLTIQGEHDLFGDGRIVCFPTYGHTPGHQSLRVRLDGGAEVILAGDACYLRRTLDDLHLPSVVFDREAMLASLRRLRVLRDGGAQIVFGHDPEAWTAIPQGPVAMG